MKLVFTIIGCLALFEALEAGVSMNNPSYCYMTDWIRPQNQMLSTRSPYVLNKRTQIDPIVSSCTPARFWYLGRDGGRTPVAGDLSDMIELADSTIQEDIRQNSEMGRSTMCREDIDLIQLWVRYPNETLENANELTISGWATKQNIATRYQQFFPTLLPSVYDPEWFFFRYNDQSIFIRSMHAFVDGIFGDGSWNDVNYEPVPDFDFFLNPYDNCPAYREKFLAPRRERDAFEQGPEVQQMLLEINARLGLTGANQLNLRRVLAMWNFCRHDLSRAFEVSESPIGDDSAWCAPFTIVHNQILGYRFDLGYFYELNNQQLIEDLNCGLFQDLLQHIQVVDGPVTKIHIARGIVLLGFLRTLGVLGFDMPIHQHNFAQHVNRAFDTSFIEQNGSNLAVITYSCADGDNDVLFLLNERPLIVPGCQQNGICKASFLLERFQRYIGVDCEAVFCPPSAAN